MNDLDLLVIQENIKKREQEEEQKRPYLELPLPQYDYYDRQEAQDKVASEPKRVIIIDL